MNERLTLQDIIDLLAEKQKITKKDAENFVRELISLISESIESNDSVKIKDFGTFKLVKVNSRKSVNVNTGDAIEIKAHYKLSFVPDKLLRDLINAPFAHFESVLVEDGVDFSNIEFDTNLPASEDEDIENEEEGASVEETIIEDKPEIVEPTSPVVEEVKEEIVTEAIAVTQEEVVEKLEVPTAELQNDIKIEEEPVATVVEEVVQNITPPPTPDSNDDNDDYELDYQEPKSNTWIYGTIFAVVVLLICIYGFRAKISEFLGITPTEAVVVEQLKTDTIKSSLISDTIVAEKSVIDSTKTNTVAEVVQPAKEYKAKAVVTIKSGNTLRKIALKQYGNKSFWVYIYQENKDKITNFNNVPIGTELTIPAAEKYDIKSSDPKSVAKAKALEDGYFRK